MWEYQITNNITILKQCKHGTFAMFECDAPIGHCLRAYGEWAEPEMHFLKQVCRTDSVVIDVGSNIGTHTVFFARNCPKGVIYSFEPQYYIYELLVTNILLNNCFNVKHYREAVTDEYETINLVNLPPTSEKNINYGEFKISNKENGIETTCRKIDSLNLSRLDLIKIDVEGHEESVLRSAKDSIDKLKPFLYIEFNAKEGNPKLLETLDSFGYDCYWHVYEKFSPNNYNNNKTNIWIDKDQPKTLRFIDKYFEGNIFCVHRSKENVSLDLHKVENYEDNYVKYLLRNEMIEHGSE